MKLHISCTSTNWSFNVPKQLTASKQPDRHSKGQVILSFRVSAELRSRFADHCRDRDITTSDVLRELMTTILKAAKND